MLYLTTISDCVAIFVLSRNFHVINDTSLISLTKIYQIIIECINSLHEINTIRHSDILPLHPTQMVKVWMNIYNQIITLLIANF